MAKVIIYSKKICGYCVAAKNIFNQKKQEFEEIMLDGKPELYVQLRKQTGMMTVPQIFIDDQFIGGYDELSALEFTGDLDKLLK